MITWKLQRAHAHHARCQIGLGVSRYSLCEWNKSKIKRINVRVFWFWMKLKIVRFVLSPSPAWDQFHRSIRFAFCSQFIQHACDVLLLYLHSRAAQTRTHIVHKRNKVLSVFRPPSCYGNVYIRTAWKKLINRERTQTLSSPILLSRI